jgi:FlaA1/EpsC-like NDP-sugar epimerase
MLAHFCGSLASMLAIELFFYPVLPLSYYLLNSLLGLTLMMGARIGRRLTFELVLSRIINTNGNHALIIGAGYSGRSLLKRLRFDSDQNWKIIGFVDDDAEKQNKTIEGIPVLGNTNQIKNLIERYDIQHIAISISKANGELVSKIFDQCAEHNIKPLIVNKNLNSGLDVLKPVSLEDLLSRPTKLNLDELVSSKINNKKILVTGAGGSIGSELCRQIKTFGPKELHILDHSEYAVFNILNELNSSSTNVKVYAHLVDLKDSECVEQIFSNHEFDGVFHAAAYKHVHLVEANPFSAIANNIGSTLSLLQLCEKHNIEHFTLISTDKAVNPVGVMGATKRVCEILVAVYGIFLKKPYHAVRFGNVLGSSGSLIPLLESQIQSGNPISITHKDMTRFFMLIPEAVSLVLNAFSISEPGQLHVLKMGKPLKILDIAKRLIHLKGLTEQQVPINFIGLRPGEKMYEELYISGNELQTKHPDILTVPTGDNLPLEIGIEELKSRLDFKIEELLLLSKQSEKKSLFILNSFITGDWVKSETDNISEENKVLKILKNH